MLSHDMFPRYANGSSDLMAEAAATENTSLIQGIQHVDHVESASFKLKKVIALH